MEVNKTKQEKILFLIRSHFSFFLPTLKCTKKNKNKEKMFMHEVNVSIYILAPFGPPAKMLIQQNLPPGMS